MRTSLPHFLVIIGLSAVAGGLFWAAGIQAQEGSPTPVPDDTLATPLQVAEAMAAWETSEHASTFDDGMGADTTCARCKSPMNWDPSGLAAEAAMNCSSCKRIPGQPRPVLMGGEAVSEEDWRHIGCEVCHEPVGDTFRVEAAFWNQSLANYEPVESPDDLCAHCHEGSHGFEVTEEVRKDDAHPGWSCLDCHDPHGGSVACTDCHDATTGPGAEEHLTHTDVHCTACHDAGNLGLWRDYDAGSQYEDVVITRRFAHTLTSWPSHNLQTEVACQRCHHPGSIERPALAQTVSCGNENCHPSGAVLYWCMLFPRDVQP
ncbi:MAG: hypothetical protein IPK19_08990 [Chloroflexi bacterium]|nr:hypothetical protein [Chloroflexota bacterium]